MEPMIAYCIDPPSPFGPLDDMRRFIADCLADPQAMAYPPMAEAVAQVQEALAWRLSQDCSLPKPAD